MSYLIQVAMREELPDDVLAHYRNVVALLRPGGEPTPARVAAIAIVISGAGKVAAAAAVAAAVATGQGLSGVISIGYCGALSERLVVGDVIVPSSLLQYDYGARTSRGEWLARPGRRTLRYERSSLADVLYRPDDLLVARLIDRCKAVGVQVNRGVLVSGDRFVTDRETGARLRAQTSADAIDMESAAVAQACELHGVPCAAVRVVSDSFAVDGEAEYRKTLSSPNEHYGVIVAAVIETLLRPPSASS